LVSMMPGGESAPPSGSSPWTVPLGSVPRAAGSSTPLTNLRRVNFLMSGTHRDSLRLGQRWSDCNTGSCGGNCEVRLVGAVARGHVGLYITHNPGTIAMKHFTLSR